MRRLILPFLWQVPALSLSLCSLSHGSCAERGSPYVKSLRSCYMGLYPQIPGACVETDSPLSVAGTADWHPEAPCLVRPPLTPVLGQILHIKPTV